MKALFYCTKSKLQLFRDIITGKWLIDKIKNRNSVNGKIVGECDYEVEEIEDKVSYFDSWFNDGHHTQTLSNKELEERTCLTYLDLYKYLGSGEPNEKVGYAIHIKNLEIFDEPKELKEFEKIFMRYEFENERCDFCSKDSCENCRCHYLLVDLDKAPQNMMYVFDGEEKKVLISIHPEWLCKILNGEKKIEVRKKVLKEMI